MERIMATFAAKTYGSRSSVIVSIAKGLSSYAVDLTLEEFEQLKKVINDAQNN